MSKNAAIEIFLRVRPTKRKADKFCLIPDDSKAIFTGMKQMKKSEYVNNTRNEYHYAFNGVFDMQSKQEDVFDRVAKDVIDNAFDGFNGTVFAYGQTGSGKTYTMTGSAERYLDRGIIPRTVSYIFSEIGKKTDTEFNVNISYLEIYNNDGYDLLSEDHASKQLSDLPRVKPLERSNGELHLDGLSIHRVAKEEDALNLLFIGDTNRMVCETPMNDASTRSHCIFLVSIESRKLDSDVKTVSKVHLVDLSGSERVGKTGVSGQLLKEACYINQSLHFLEQVINSLQKKMNAADPDNYFIPYRNSLMTMVLRDSLGGNCKTRMITTVHVEEDYLDESISTCNFAMRVALIKNTLVRNEAVDPNVIIQRLKRENQELKAEIALLRGGHAKMELTQEDVARCQKMVQEYVTTKDPTQKLILSDPLMILQCFVELRMLIQNQKPQLSDNKVVKKEIQKEIIVDTEKVTRLETEVERLKLILKQRENEIAIFLNLINTRKAHQDDPQKYNEPPKTARETRDEEVKSNIANLRQTQELKFPAYSKKEEDDNYGMVYSVVRPGGDVVDYHSKNPSAHMNKPALLNGALPAGSLDKTGYSRQSEQAESSTKSSKPEAMQLKAQASLQVASSKPVSKEMAEANSLLNAPLAITKEQLMDRQACFEMFRRNYRKAEALAENKQLMEDLASRGKKFAEEIKVDKARLDSLKVRIEDIRRVQALQGMKAGGDWQRTPEEEQLLGENQQIRARLQPNVEKFKEIKEEITRVQVTYENVVKKMNKDFERWLTLMMVGQGLNESGLLETTKKTVADTSVTLASKPNYAQGNKGTDSTTAGLNNTFILGNTTLNDTAFGLNTTTTSKVDTSHMNERNKKNLESFYKAKDALYSTAGRMSGDHK